MSRLEEIKGKIEELLKKEQEELTNEISTIDGYLSELERVTIDRETLQSTKIGVVLTKLSKKVENVSKDTFDRVNGLIKNWKEALKSTGSTPSKRQKTEHTDSSSPREPPVSAETPYSGALYNDEMRNKALRYLFKSFVSGHSCNPDIAVLNKLVYDIEGELYTHYITRLNAQKEYNLQLKSIGFNLKDPNNKSFNDRIYKGEINSLDLVTMKSIDMASDEKKLQRNNILQESLQACQSDWAVKNIFLNNKSKGQFRCFKCKSSDTVYHQMQTRSSDEPMTTFVTCLKCQNRWKF
ncbi:transcription elongation factor S-II, putative [Theileria equi strain WA]|uniref:Transcription elongation factor S-II, putative n=1 Tax=Theileria equi strain WA TaxID=1537102 RepID=L0AYZ3_THEEQ|nr:transcription elongation factor S-II, putative [Theileria equi strain WA]AFZ80812.1 transcription elongation factor S-II, putative [Theileria equi strain WA]|eukprot:XP_004830478.1 transcription elongation factor S-II, putative [Theileria equi strain WA]